MQIVANLEYDDYVQVFILWFILKLLKITARCQELPFIWRKGDKARFLILFTFYKGRIHANKPALLKYHSNSNCSYLL